MRTIPLTKGAVALVDDENFDEISKFKWHLTYYGYAARRVCTGTGKKSGSIIYMHRIILQDAPVVDHIDGNKLNNSKTNLRVSNKSLNAANRGAQTNNTSGFKGVYFHKQLNKWVAHITKNKKTKYLGSFYTKEVAANVYNLEAVKLFGDHAKVNIL